MSEPFVGIQVGAISFLDEGISSTLDYLQKAGGVNALFISALSWSDEIAGRATSSFPDHGGQERDHLRGGAFFSPNEDYYDFTPIKRFRAPDAIYGDFDVLADVIPEARRRGIRVFPYYAETATRTYRPIWQAGFSQVLEIDAFGRASARPCLRHPAYRAWWFGVVENWIGEYDVDGIMWGLERQSPLVALLMGDDATCFCVHCATAARHQNIDVERAAAGYRAVMEWLERLDNPEQTYDGYLISFLRILATYPDVFQWERFWIEGHKSLYKEISGKVKFLDERCEFGLGLWQMLDTFNPYLRAHYDPSEYRMYADWIKPVLYNAPAGSRLVTMLNTLCGSVLRDAPPASWLTLLYAVLGLDDEAPYEEVAKAGLSASYVASHTRRMVTAVGGEIPVYPGIGVGVEGSAQEITPAIVSAAIEAAFEGGASGIVVARKYSEMNRDCVEAVGHTLRRLNRA